MNPLTFLHRKTWIVLTSVTAINGLILASDLALANFPKQKAMILAMLMVWIGGILWASRIEYRRGQHNPNPEA